MVDKEEGRRERPPRDERRARRGKKGEKAAAILCSCANERRALEGKEKRKKGRRSRFLVNIYSLV